LERHQSGKLLTIFDPKYILSHLNTTEEIQDGVKIKNDAKNLKIYIIFAAKRIQDGSKMAAQID
jgi:hypothetical protein